MEAIVIVLWGDDVVRKIKEGRERFGGDAIAGCGES
jgi:hypothetical protein